MQRIAVAVAVGMAVSFTAGAQVGAAQAADGEALYRRHCRTCHGANGAPSSRMQEMYPTIASLIDSTLTDRLSVDSLVTLFVNGVGEMKSYSDKLTREEMVAVAEYTRALSKGTP